MTSFTPWLALAAFVYALMETIKALAAQDWDTLAKRAAALGIGVSAALVATRSGFAAEIPLGSGRTFANLSFWDCLFVGPTLAGAAMTVFGVVDGIGQPAATNVVTNAAPVEPALPDPPPLTDEERQALEPLLSLPKITRPVRTADSTIDQSQAQTAEHLVQYAEVHDQQKAAKKAQKKVGPRKVPAPT